jgi:hypothetical protein
LVVGLFEPLAVTDDRPLVAKRAEPRQQLQRDLGQPGLVFGFWQSDQKNHGSRKPAAVALAGFEPGLHAAGKVVSNERRILLSASQRTEIFSTSMIGRFRTH